MKLSRICLIQLLILLPAVCFASGKTIVCDEPMGPRMDYFTQNSANLQNDQFLVGRDELSNMHVRLFLDDNNQDVSFDIGTTEQLMAMPVTKNMKVLTATQDLVSFSGMVSNEAILATYYTTMKVIVYSQQSTWPGDTFSGARATLFYARCNAVITPSPAATVPIKSVATTPAQMKPSETTPSATTPAATAPATAQPAPAVPAATDAETPAAETPSAEAPAGAAPSATTPSDTTPVTPAPAEPEASTTTPATTTPDDSSTTTPPTSSIPSTLSPTASAPAHAGKVNG